MRCNSCSCFLGQKSPEQRRREFAFYSIYIYILWSATLQAAAGFLLLGHQGCHSAAHTPAPARGALPGYRRLGHSHRRRPPAKRGKRLATQNYRWQNGKSRFHIQFSSSLVGDHWSSSHDWYLEARKSTPKVEKRYGGKNEGKGKGIPNMSQTDRRCSFAEHTWCSTVHNDNTVEAPPTLL